MSILDELVLGFCTFALAWMLFVPHEHSRSTAPALSIEDQQVLDRYERLKRELE